MEAIQEVNAAPVAATNGSGGDVMELMRMCMDRMGGESAAESVAVMEKLIEMKRGLDADAARSAFARDLAAFQSECPPVTKTSMAKIQTDKGSFSYKYAELDQIDRTARPHLAKYGFSFSWRCESNGGAMNAVCTLRHRDGHAESASFPAIVEAKGRMSGVQNAASALTYAKRQSLILVLGITTADSDTDGIAPDGKRATAEKITANQAKDIDALLDEMKLDRAAFLKWARVDRTEDILASDYREVMDALEAKRKQRAQEGAKS